MTVKHSKVLGTLLKGNGNTREGRAEMDSAGLTLLEDTLDKPMCRLLKDREEKRTEIENN